MPIPLNYLCYCWRSALVLSDFMHLWQTCYHVEHVCFFRVCIFHACTGLWPLKRFNKNLNLNLNRSRQPMVFQRSTSLMFLYKILEVLPSASQLLCIMRDGFSENTRKYTTYDHWWSAALCHRSVALRATFSAADHGMYVSLTNYTLYTHYTYTGVIRHGVIGHRCAP